jgi:ketosteroid isomerase-like protein
VEWPWAEGLATGALASRTESDSPDAAEAGHRNGRSVARADIVYRPITAWAESEECRGREAYLRFSERFLETWADDSTWTEDTLRVDGGSMVGLWRFSGRAKASGVEVSGGVFSVDRFRDGKIASIEDVTDRDAAVRAAEQTA